MTDLNTTAPSDLRRRAAEVVATAGALGEGGEPDRAVKVLEGLCAELAAELGPAHPMSLVTRNDLATWLGQGGRHHESVTRFERLAHDSAAVHGPDHPTTTQIIANRAAFVGLGGDPAGARNQLHLLLGDQSVTDALQAPELDRIAGNLQAWLRRAPQPEPVALAPRLRALVEADSFATLSVTMLGCIRTYVMWVGAEGEDLFIVTDAASPKLRALRLNPSVTLVVWDRLQPTHYVEVLGTAVAVEVSEDARRLLEVELASRYNGRPYPRPDVGRWAKITIRPSRQRVW